MRDTRSTTHETTNNRKWPRFNRLVTADRLSQIFFSYILNNVECISDRQALIKDFQNSDRTLYFMDYSMLQDLTAIMDTVKSSGKDIDVCWFYGPFEHIILQSEIITSRFGYIYPPIDCTDKVSFYKEKLKEALTDHPLPYCSETLCRCFVDDCGRCEYGAYDSNICKFYREGFKPREVLGLSRYVEIAKLFDADCVKDLVIDAKSIQKYLAKLESESFDFDSAEMTNLFN